MTDKRPLKVFLCHASTDKPKVRELYRYLKKRGIQPWFDEEDLVGGQDWQVEIPKALATSDAIIICLTKNSVDKEGYIQKEIKFALDKALEMPEGRIFLIPVKFEECEVPFTLSRYQWVDLTVESGYAKMMKALKFRASQLERSAVEISKKDVKEENLARDKKERERISKEVREKHEREIAEKDAREKLNFLFLYFRYYVLPAILILGVSAGGYYFGRPFFDRVISPTQELIVVQTSTPQPSQLLTNTVVPSPVILPSSTVVVANIPKTGDVKKSLIDGMDMVYFAVDGNVESFWVDQNPVQNSMFAKFVQETGYQTDAEKNGFGYVWTSLGELGTGPGNAYEAYAWKEVGGADWKNPRYEDSYINNILYKKSENPSSYDVGDIVLQVSWNDAKAYCNWADKDLLTASEWEVILDNGYELGNFSIFVTDSLGYRFYIYEWADDKIGSRNRAVVFGAQLLEESLHSLTTVPGFIEYRSANILTFRCKE